MANKKRIAKTATSALVFLWEDGFFRTWRKMDAVVAELAKREHHFSDPALGMALKGSRHLTRQGPRGNYEYVQKYPFVVERADTPAPQKGGKK
jgi:hypothetical protein